MTSEEWQTLQIEWQAEKDKLYIQLKEANNSSKVMYERMDLLLKFSHELPEIFAKATPTEKRMIINTMTEKLEYDGTNLIITLKDTFRKLQKLTEVPLNDTINADDRTPENSSIETKKGVLKTPFDNGASDGLELEPFSPIETINEIIKKVNNPAFTYGLGDCIKELLVA